MNRKEFSSEELLGRWEDKREIQNLMGKLSMLYVLRREENVFGDFWSSRDDICLGVNEGWYTGRDNVGAYYAAFRERTLLTSRLIASAFPEKLADKTEGELYGVGLMSYKPLDTGVVEIARDGETAKGIWFCRGCHAELTTGGPVAYWEWAWFAVDFIKEEGEWKIWHVLNVQDVDAPCGVNWGEPCEKYPEIEEFEAMQNFKMPEPNVKMTLRERYTPMRPFTPTPDLPESYKTFAETFSYGM